MSQYANDGTWKVVCPVCGLYKYSDKMRRRWDGVMVCENDWEIRHPQELYRARTEDNSLPFANPDVTHAEISTADWGGLGETDHRGVGEGQQIGDVEDESGYFGSYFDSFFGSSYF